MIFDIALFLSSPEYMLNIQVGIVFILVDTEEFSPPTFENQLSS